MIGNYLDSFKLLNIYLNFLCLHKQNYRKGHFKLKSENGNSKLNKYNRSNSKFGKTKFKYFSFKNAKICL